MTIDEQQFLTESNLNKMFRNFDYDNKKYITILNMKDAFERSRRDLNFAELQPMFEEIDYDGDGFIKYQDFKSYMTASK